jgi:hypothetical protein
MRKLISVGIACLVLGLAGTAQAQTTSTTQRMMPNGNMRTTSRTNTMGGSATTRTVDRADGSRTVVRRQTNAEGDVRTVRHDRGSNRVRVCHSRWMHGHRVRQCHTRYR